MGDIVFGAAGSHAPGLTAFPERADADAAEHVLSEYRLAANALVAAGVDAAVFFTVDHFTAFFLDNLPTFAIGTAPEYQGPASAALASFLHVEQETFPGAQQLGTHIMRSCLDAGFDPSRVEGDLLLDENVCVPRQLLGVDVPIVPIIVNAVRDPMPSLPRCFAFGQAVGQAIREDSDAGRVAVIATGGLSHSVGTAMSGSIDSTFDAEFLSWLTGQRDVRTLDQWDDTVLDAAGNGAHEVRAWVMWAGALGELHVSSTAYEAIPEWLTGVGVAVARRAGSDTTTVATSRSVG
jgi:protocatechuate 4,5-dioxygenase beta chain/2,3-dihydroxyphenylpropionate 1,2-dioxygenase